MSQSFLIYTQLKAVQRNIYLMFHLVNLIDSGKYMLTLNLLPATHFNKMGQGQQKTGKNAKETPGEKSSKNAVHQVKLTNSISLFL